jgi:RluA family pseudouridine synthase
VNSKKELIQELNRGALAKRVLYRDAGLVVIDKPSGIPVHIGAHAGVALEQYFDQLMFDLPHAPWLAHRLDRETSGCLVLGRTKEALARVGKQFAEGKIGKTYWAIAVGIPAQDSGVIHRPILKTGKGSRWRIILDDAGQEAITEYRVLGKAEGISWLEFTPRTGRTHQIRVHAAYALGCPLVGDPFYSGEGTLRSLETPSAASGSRRLASPLSTSLRVGATQSMMLHARSIALPAKGDPITVTAPVPEHMRALLEKCGYQD